MKINPLKSQLLGLILSLFAGVEAGYISWWFFTEKFYYHKFGSFVGTVLGISIGGIVAFNVFTKHQRDVPWNHEGTICLFGKRTEVKCSAGRYWVPWFCEIHTVNIDPDKPIPPLAAKVVISKETSNLVRTIMIVIAIVLGINAIQRNRGDGKNIPMAHKAIRIAPSECDLTRATYLHTLHVQADGSTKIVSIPEGKNVCFEASFWDNLERLGYRTSDGVGPEKLYRCTQEEVASGTCNERFGTTFQFTPGKGVPLPKYWFVNGT